MRIVLFILILVSCDTVKIRDPQKCYRLHGGGQTYNFVKHEGHKSILKNTKTGEGIAVWNSDLIEADCLSN